MIVSKALGFLGKARELFGRAKQIQEGIALFIELGERADDDLDGDGKAEYQNVIEESNALAAEIVVDAKQHFSEICMTARDHYGTALRIIARGQKLIAHVRNGK